MLFPSCIIQYLDINVQVTPQFSFPNCSHIHHSYLWPLPEAPSRLLLLLLIRIQIECPAGNNRPERVTILQQINHLPILRLQTPFRRLEQAARRWPLTGEAHDATGLSTAHAEADVDAPAHLVHLARDPRDLLVEVDVVAQHRARLFVCA
jgi:hypothetical protein